MKTNLSWKKDWFSNVYNIYNQDVLVGTFKDKSFSYTATGELNGKGYIFKTKGFLNQRTEIIDSSDNKPIGEITYNSWMNKATITVNNKTVYWKYDNIWNTQWSLLNSEGIQIKYTSSTTNGQIVSNVSDPILILCGLFVTNYYRQMTAAVLIVVFIPLFVN